MVVIKPNIAWDRTPEQAANTNPLAVAEMVRQCLDAGAKKVIVTDVSCNEPHRCFQRSGIARAASDEGAEVVLPEERLFRAGQPARRRSGRVARARALHRRRQDDQFPVAKSHSLTGVTLGMKNWYGILGGARNRLHQRIHESLADLADVMRPTLTLIDAYRVLIRNGPTGGSLADVLLKKTLVAGTDPVALDAYVAKAYWDIEPSQLRYLQLAQDRGLGKMDFAKRPDGSGQRVSQLSHSPSSIPLFVVFIVFFAGHCLSHGDGFVGCLGDFFVARVGQVYQDFHCLAAAGCCRPLRWRRAASAWGLTGLRRGRRRAARQHPVPRRPPR